MNIHRASEHDEFIKDENYDKYGSRVDQYSAERYADEYRELADIALMNGNPQLRKDYLDLAELLGQ